MTKWPTEYLTTVITYNPCCDARRAAAPGCPGHRVADSGLIGRRGVALPRLSLRPDDRLMPGRRRPKDNVLLAYIVVWQFKQKYIIEKKSRNKEMDVGDPPPTLMPLRVYGSPKTLYEHYCFSFRS